MDLSARQGRREQGQRIQRAVERAGLSIEELAGRIGCSRALIYQYLSGTTLAQPDRLQQIAFECGVPLTYFYGEEAPEAPAPNAASPSTSAASVSTSSATPQGVTARLEDSLRALQELAMAQEGPPDYRALAATCERILSLAAQLGDRSAQARAQKSLGNALLRMADYPRAADALARAVGLAVAAGDLESETSARQSLGNAFISMGRAQEAREQFARIAGGTVFRGRWQGTLSLGGLDEMRGEYQQAMQRYDETAALLEAGEANGQARAEEVATGLLYVNASRATVYMDGGDFRGARPLAEKCLADAEAQGNADQHLEARFDLAWCDFGTGRWAAAHRGFSTMLQLARFVGDQGRETMARAWLGILLAASGDHDAATAHGKDALAMALSRGDRRAELYAQLALADAYTGAGRRESEARYHASQAIAIATAMRHDRGEIECRLRLARLSAQSGDPDESREAAIRAVTLAQRLGARHLESLARCWLAQTQMATSSETIAAVASPAAEVSPAPDAEPNFGMGAGFDTTEMNADARGGRAQIREELEAALEMADGLECVEPRWRAHDLLARLALQDGQREPNEAETHWRAAIGLLDGLRADLLAAGLADTLLENEDYAQVYLGLARLLFGTQRGEAAAQFLEQTGWPPLLTRLDGETASGANPA